jgi:hypothetical protein
MGRYSYTTGNRWILLLVFAAFIVFGAVFIVLAITRPDGPPLLFVLAWIAILAWNGYWFLWRLSYRIQADGDRLLWTTPLRTGEARVGDVAAVRAGWLGQMMVVELRDGETLMSLNRKGVSEFAEALTGERSDPETFGERIRRLGQPSAFQRQE